MKNRTFFIAGLVIFLLYPFFGCDAGINGGSDDGNNTAMQIVQVTPRELQKPEDVNPAARSVAAGANGFAFRLSAALAKQSGTAKNLVCSPLSVWIPLTALVNAAGAQYKADLLAALGVQGIEDADINNGVSRMLYDLTRQKEREYKEMGWQKDYHEPLKIANAVFVDYDVTIKDDFAQAFMDYYRGSSINVDFESPAAVIEVNDWVNKNTGGMIQNIIEKFDPATPAVLANAVYFFDRWEWEFDEKDTKPDTFYAPRGETEASYMLREGDGQTYFEDEKLQAMPLEFTTGGGLYILLPKDGDAAGLPASLTGDYFLAIQNGSKPAEGRLLLPRFSIEGDMMRLKDTLKAMGIPLFENSSLTGLIEKTDVQLSEALHKAVIKVDEKGTTAAAVTVLLPDPASAEPEPPGEPFEMICNKPFAFILYDRTTDGGMQVLFTGMVNQP
ncbi:MAG: serpin family protein [Treponema sp.]|jgi:serpin B|nr:serpin family protein [Treponema sp.]